MRKPPTSTARQWSTAALWLFHGLLPRRRLRRAKQHGTLPSLCLAVAPECQFKVGYQITRCIQASVGYDSLYISNTDRPGNRLNANINPTQSWFLNGGNLHGESMPVNCFQSSGFWAQGINFGLELKF